MSIINKLNLTKFKNLTVLNQPEDYDVFHDCNTKLSGGHDAIFIFVKTLDEMVKYTQQIINEQQLVENGYLFFAYPKKTNSSAASQCVADYEDQVKDVEELLSPYPKEQQFFKELPPGYQRDWARYILSAKQQTTREKRLEQMVDVLAQGYKSIDLYRQKKK